MPQAHHRITHVVRNDTVGSFGTSRISRYNCIKEADASKRRVYSTALAVARIGPQSTPKGMVIRNRRIHDADCSSVDVDARSLPGLPLCRYIEFKSGCGANPATGRIA